MSVRARSAGEDSKRRSWDVVGIAFRANCGRTADSTARRARDAAGVWAAELEVVIALDAVLRVGAVDAAWNATVTIAVQQVAFV